MGRNINYLRVSVTQRCNLNCVYCGGDFENCFELTPEQIEKIVKNFVHCGIEKVRLTGGEPLVRNDIAEIAERISKINGIKKLVLTTNAVGLKKHALALKEAGVSAVNVSLDTLDKETYKTITGTDCLNRVLEGIDEAARVGLSPLRINAVLIKGQNENSAEALINLARERKIDVRFIELMPFSEAGENKSLVVTGDEILEQFPFLKPVNQKGSAFENSVARYYEAEGFKGRIGLITPVSHKFCSECNRIRLLSTGEVKPCLGNNMLFDLKPYFDDDEKMIEIIKQAVLSKPQAHSFACGYGNTHSMNRIGG